MMRTNKSSSSITQILLNFQTISFISIECSKQKFPFALNKVFSKKFSRSPINSKAIAKWISFPIKILFTTEIIDNLLSIFNFNELSFLKASSIRRKAPIKAFAWARPIEISAASSSLCSPSSTAENYLLISNNTTYPVRLAVIWPRRKWLVKLLNSRTARFIFFARNNAHGSVMSRSAFLLLHATRYREYFIWFWKHPWRRSQSGRVWKHHRLTRGRALQPLNAFQLVARPTRAAFWFWYQSLAFQKLTWCRLF